MSEGPTRVGPSPFQAIGAGVPAAKSLEDHVRDQTFRSRRHHELLDGPVVRWPELAAIQARYRAAEIELERRAFGVTFERAIRELAPAKRKDELDALLAILRRPPVVRPDIFTDDDALREFELEIEQWNTTKTARSLRSGGATWAAIGRQLGLTASTIRRRVLRFEKTYGYRAA